MFLFYCLTSLWALGHGSLSVPSSIIGSTAVGFSHFAFSPLMLGLDFTAGFHRKLEIENTPDNPERNQKNILSFYI